MLLYDLHILLIEKSMIYYIKQDHPKCIRIITQITSNLLLISFVIVPIANQILEKLLQPYLPFT